MIGIVSRTGIRSGIAGVALALLSATAAQGSGRLPPLPIPSQKFADLAACRAHLDQTYRDDLAKADPEPVPIDGGTRQTLIESEGPVGIDTSHVDYAITEGWQIRHPEPDKGYVQISYSYRTTTMACDGGVLTGTYAQGYNSPSYEHPTAPGSAK
jgi:hypothetical protein